MRTCRVFHHKARLEHQFLLLKRLFLAQVGVQKFLVLMCSATGRVRVVIRIRPSISTDSGTDEVISWQQQVLQIRDPANSAHGYQSAPIETSASLEPARQFVFDEILGPSTEQQEVFEHVGIAICKDVLCGYNGTIMAYGQTGAGKTYTLSNPTKPNHGLIPRSVAYLFDEIDADKEYEYTILCSYMQIYNENIFDLLGKDTKTPLSLRESPGTGVFVEDLTEYVVRSPHEVMDLLTKVLGVHLPAPVVDVYRGANGSCLRKLK